MSATYPHERSTTWLWLLIAFLAVGVIGLIVFGVIALRSAPSVGGDSVVSGAVPNAAERVVRRMVRATDDPIRGRQGAPVRIVAFKDFECPYCREAVAPLQQLLQAYPGDIELVYVDFPLTDIHPLAFAAAIAGECAFRQDLFWEYHDLLYQNQAALTAPDLLSYAQRLQMDMTAFQACQRSSDAAAAVHEDIREGKRLGVTATPTFFVNGIEYRGALSFTQWRQIVDNELR